MPYKYGSLPEHLLVCGYVERVRVANGKEITQEAAEAMRAGDETMPHIQVSLWAESGHFHVRAHEFDGRGRLMWDAFDPGELGKARKAFRATVARALAGNL